MRHCGERQGFLCCLTRPFVSLQFEFQRRIAFRLFRFMLDSNALENWKRHANRYLAGKKSRSAVQPA